MSEGNIFDLSTGRAREEKPQEKETHFFGLPKVRELLPELTALVAGEQLDGAHAVAHQIEYLLRRLVSSRDLSAGQHKRVNRERDDKTSRHSSRSSAGRRRVRWHHDCRHPGSIRPSSGWCSASVPGSA
jgi:hypothetical protein